MQTQTTVCKDCKYYIQHYRKGANMAFYCIYCGHCVHRRPKNRKPDSKACEFFEQQEKNKNLHSRFRMRKTVRVRK